MVKKTDEGLVLNSDAQKALDSMLKDMMIFINAIKDNENIQRLNAALIQQLELVAQQATELRAKVKNGKKVDVQELAKLVNDLNRAKDTLNTYKFEDKNVKMLRQFGRALPGAKAIDELPAQKQMNEMQSGIKAIIDRIQQSADVIVRNAAPKHRSLWKRFTDACIDFAKTCKNKILSLFAKNKKVEAAPKAVSYKEAHMQAVKEDPVKRQGVMAAAAAAAKAKRAAELRAEKEKNDVVSPTPPQRPARPPRKF